MLDRIPVRLVKHNLRGICYIFNKLLHLDAYLELNHLPHVLKLGEHVLVELQELLVGLFVTVLETRVCVIVISPALLHAKSNEHPSDE